MPVRPAGAPGPGTASRLVASVPWIVVLLGVVTLAVLLLVASLSFRVREPEPVAVSAPPPMLPVPRPAEVTTAPSASHSPEPSRSGTVARPSRTSARPSPTPSRSPSSRPSSPARGPEQVTPLDGGALTATYRVRDVDRDDVTAELVIRNGTGAAEEWTVGLTFDGRVRGVRVFGDGIWLDRRGDGRYVLGGHRPLGVGQSVTVGLRFNRDDRDDRLSGCTVNGNECVRA